MHLPINSCLGEHSHEMKTAGGNVNNPFGPKLHTCRKGYRKQRPPRNRLHVLFATFQKM